MAQKCSYTDLVHNIVRDAEESLSLDEITQRLVEASADSPPKNPRNNVRTAIRSSHLIKPAGKSRYAWLPRRVKGARVRHTLTGSEYEKRYLVWDHDAMVALWPAADEPERRRDRDNLLLETGGGQEFSLALQEEEGVLCSHPDSAFWAWLSEQKAEAGDDLIITISEPENHRAMLRWEGRAQRNVGLIEERNRLVKKRIENFLTTQREGVASPKEIAADLLSSHSYHDSVPPQSLSNLLPAEVTARYGAAVEPDNLKSEKVSNVIPFPSKTGGESGEHARVAGAENLASGSDAVVSAGSVELTIPYNSGQELPDDKAYQQGMDMLHEATQSSPALAIHILGISRLCSPAYALLSQTAEYRKEALDLAGQSVIAAERRIAHGFIESLVSGQEFPVEEAMATYLEARSFLARALWHGGSFDEAIEQAMHCFEVDPENPAVREDLFVMLFDSERHDMVLSLLDSFPGASVTEDLYHRALAALLDDPESKDAARLLRKATTHNPYLASLFLGEEPKKAKKSQVDEGDAYEAAYGFLWRREDSIFDLLEEIVLAKR
jgi:tetratricopeptide (TPR) repeat protein